MLSFKGIYLFQASSAGRCLYLLRVLPCFGGTVAANHSFKADGFAAA